MYLTRLILQPNPESEIMLLVVLKAQKARRATRVQRKTAKHESSPANLCAQGPKRPRGPAWNRLANWAAEQSCRV